MSKKKKKRRNTNVKLKSTQRQKKSLKLPTYLIVAIIACVIMITVATIVTIVVANRQPKVVFIPPEFDAAAVDGVPEIPAGYKYGELNQEKLPYKVGLCGEAFVENGNAMLYFTNPSENNAWLKLRIIDEQGTVIGESGLIKPGQYLPSVKLNKKIAKDTPVSIKIMSYEPDTYNSLGAFSMKSTLKVK